MNVLKIITELIENPFSKKSYRDLKIYYKSIGMLHEAEALNLLIKQKFNDANDTSSDQE